MPLPTAPPRRKKTGMTPLLPRKELFLAQQPPQLPSPPRPQAPPSPSLSIREKVKRMISPGNRALPELPKPKEGKSTTCTIAVTKLIIFPSNQAPPQPQSRPTTPLSESSTKSHKSLQMTRIQNQTSAALSRMAILQQRYQDHQEMLRSNGDLNHRSSMDLNGQNVSDLSTFVIYF